MSMIAPSAGAGAGREADLLVDGDVVAAGGRPLRAARLTRVAAVGEQDRRGDDLRRGRVRLRDLDDRDLVVRVRAGVGAAVVLAADVVGLRRTRAGGQPRAARCACASRSRSARWSSSRGAFGSRTSKTFRPSHVVGAVGVGVAVLLQRVVGAARVGRRDQDPVVDRDVVLRARADDLVGQRRVARVADVPDRDALVVALVGVAVLEREVRVECRVRRERAVLAARGDQPQPGGAGLVRLGQLGVGVVVAAGHRLAEADGLLGALPGQIRRVAAVRVGPRRGARALLRDGRSPTVRRRPARPTSCETGEHRPESLEHDCSPVDAPPPQGRDCPTSNQTLME